MEDLINEFISETRDGLQALAGEIVAWEAAPDDRARLDSIFRFVHTVKGNSGFFDLPRLQALSHAAENELGAVRAGTRSADRGLVSAVLAVIDRIGELVEALETGQLLTSADDEQLIARLTGTGPTSCTPEEASREPVREDRKTIRSIRLSVDLLDGLMSGVSDMVLARNELARRLRDAPEDIAVQGSFDRLSTCIAEMRDAITRTRMQRIDNLFVSLPRLVRDLSVELGKSVLLEMDGGDVELDREMIEMIRDPMTHIIRNAIDHGIEAGPDRLMAGKPHTGALRISARQSGNQIHIEVADDGRGIDGDKLAGKAVSAGLLTEERARNLSSAQKCDLVFEPGLSTATEITAISGRGVGMDVVRANIERIGGTVDLESKLGHGLRLTLRVPLTLTIIPALTIESGDQFYAIPRSAIEEIVRRKSSFVRVEHVCGSNIATIRDNRMPLLSLAGVLGQNLRRGGEESGGEDNLIILRPAGADLYALAVDRVCDHEELVVKPASPIVMATGLYAGTTLGEDGKPILLLDPCGLAEVGGLLSGEGGLDAGGTGGEPAAQAPREATPALLFRTLHGLNRVVPLAMVERIDEVAADAVGFGGGYFHVAIGGRLVTLAGCAEMPAGKLRILRLSDGEAELAYGFAEVTDLVAIDEDVRPASAPGEVAGVTLVNGEQVEVLDAHWLFATYAAAVPGRAEQPVCALAAGDPWMENFLRPLVESAGYRVVVEGEVPRPDVLIANAGNKAAVNCDPRNVVRIRSRPEAEGHEDDSIYRYDRAALLAALSRPAARTGSVR